MKTSSVLPFSLIEPLEARIAPTVNLLLKITSIDFPNVAVPGDTGTITMTIENIGDEPAKNTTCINIWLVPDPGAGQAPGDSVWNGGNFGRNTSKSMKIVEGDKDVPLNLQPGAPPKIVTKKFTLPDLILGQFTVAPGDLYFASDPQGPSAYHPFNMTPGLHYIVAEVDGAGENEGTFDFPNHRNDYAAPATPFDYQYSFGNVGSRSNVDLHVTSGTFDTTTRTFPGPSADFSLSGSGKGTINVVNGSVSDPMTRDNLAFTGTSNGSFAAAGVFKNKATGADRLTLNNIAADAAMKGIKLPKFDITGSVDIMNGGLGGLELGNIGGSGKHIMTAGSAGDAPAAIVLGRVNDLDLTTGMGLGVLQVTDWQKGGAADTITTPFISDLSTTGDKKAAVAGDFAADLSLSGKDAKGFVLGLTDIAGQLRQSTFTATGDGKVNDIEAASANQWGMNVAGAADDIKIKGDLAGTTATGVTAASFSSIKIEGNLGNHITATGNGPKDIAIKSVTAKAIQNVNIKAEAGRIEKVEANEWTGGGELKAKLVKTFTMKTGDFAAALTVTGMPVPTGKLFPPNSIGTASIAGALKTGPWNVTGQISSLTAGSVETGWKLIGNTSSDIFKNTGVADLIVKGAVAGEFTASTFSDIKFGGDFRGSVNATSLAGSIGSLKAANVIGGTLLANGNLNDISAKQWDGGSITGRNIGDLMIAGDFRNVTVKVTGGATDGLGKVVVGGNIVDVLFDAANSPIFSIAADGWSSSSTSNTDLVATSLQYILLTNGEMAGVRVQLTDASAKLAKVNVNGFIGSSTLSVAGSVGLIQALGMVDTNINVGLAKSIDSLAIKGKTGRAFFINTNVSAGEIGKVLVSNVEPTGAVDYGITAGRIGHYARAQDGVLAKGLGNVDAADSTMDTVGKYRLVIT